MAADPNRGKQIGKQINEFLNQDPKAHSANGDTGGGTFMGLTLGGFIFAAFFSLVGVAFVVYAKKQGRLLIGLCGAGLLVYTFFVTQTVLILVLGLVLTFLPLVLKRAGLDI